MVHVASPWAPWVLGLGPDLFDRALWDLVVVAIFLPVPAGAAYLKWLNASRLWHGSVALKTHSLNPLNDTLHDTSNLPLNDSL